MDYSVTLRLIYVIVNSVQGIDYKGCITIN